MIQPGCRSGWAPPPPPRLKLMPLRAVSRLGALPDLGGNEHGDPGLRFRRSFHSCCHSWAGARSIVRLARPWVSCRRFQALLFLSTHQKSINWAWETLERRTAATRHNQPRSSHDLTDSNRCQLKMCLPRQLGIFFFTKNPVTSLQSQFLTTICTAGLTQRRVTPSSF